MTRDVNASPKVKGTPYTPCTIPMVRTTTVDRTGGKATRRTGTEGRAMSAFLEIIRDVPFDSITVTDVCRKAGISRSTFYARFGDMDGLLEKTLDLIITGTESTGKNLRMVRWDDFRDGEPLCLYVRKHPEFQGIFYDPAVRDRVVRYIMANYSEENWNVMEEYGDMDRTGYEAVQSFQLYGCISMMAAHRDAGDEEWARIREAIDNMIRIHLREHVI